MIPFRPFQDYFRTVTFVAVPGASDDLSYLHNLPYLEALSVERSAVTDSSLSDVAGLHRLKYLWLNETQITDEGLMHLRKLKQLRYLYVEETMTTDTAVTELKLALPGCTIIR